MTLPITPHIIACDSPFCKAEADVHATFLGDGVDVTGNFCRAHYEMLNKSVPYHMSAVTGLRVISVEAVLAAISRPLPSPPESA